MASVTSGALSIQPAGTAVPQGVGRWLAWRCGGFDAGIAADRGRIRLAAWLVRPVMAAGRWHYPASPGPLGGVLNVAAKSEATFQ